MAEWDQEWDATLIAIARATARRFPMVDWQDVAQELRLWWLRTDRVSGYLTTIRESEDEEAVKTATGKLMRALKLEAGAYCQVEKAAALGYKVEDLHFYSVSELRELLPLVWDEQAWLPFWQRPDQEMRSRGNPAEGNGLIASLVDVSRGVLLLREVDRVLIQQLYRSGWTEDQLAEEYGISTEALRKRHERALVRLRDLLGGPRPSLGDGPGSRRVMSRAEAVANLEDV